MQREGCSVPNMAESPSWCGHPGSGHFWGHEGSRGANAHSPSSGRMRGWPSVTKTSPERSGKTQLSTRLARAARYVNRNPSDGPGRRRVFRAGAERQSESGPVRCPGAESTARRPLRPVPGAARARTHFPGPCPAALCRPRPAPAPPASARRWEHGAWDAARVAAPPRVPAPLPASLAGPGLPGAVLPPGSRPLPGRWPARRAQLGARPASRWQVRAGRAQGGAPRPARGRRGRYPQSRPPPPGSRGVVAGAGPPVCPLPAAWKGVRSGGEPSPLSPSCCRRRRCRSCVSVCAPVSGRVCVCVRRPAFTIYTEGVGGGGEGEGLGRWRRRGAGGGERGTRGRRLLRTDIAHGEGVAVGGARWRRRGARARGRRRGGPMEREPCCLPAGWGPFQTPGC